MNQLEEVANIKVIYLDVLPDVGFGVYDTHVGLISSSIH